MAALGIPNLTKQERRQRSAYFISSGSSLSSLVGVTLAPLFLARGHPDRLGLREERHRCHFAKQLHLPVCVPVLQVL